MSLPQAQLGYMPTINLPNGINKSTHKGPNLWEQALSAFLSGAAGSAGQQLVGNAMTPDVTDEAVKNGVLPAGTEKPGFLQKLGTGPGMTREQMIRAEQLKTQNDQFTKNQAMIVDQFAKNFGLDKTKVEAMIADNNRNFNLKSAESTFNQGATNRRLGQEDTAIINQTRWGNDKNVRENTMTPIEQRTGSAQAALLEAGGPKLKAETANLSAEAALRQSQADKFALANRILEERLKGSAAPKEDGVGFWRKLMQAGSNDAVDMNKVKLPIGTAAMIQGAPDFSEAAPVPPSQEEAAALIAKKRAIEAAGARQATDAQPVTADNVPIVRPPGFDPTKLGLTPEEFQLFLQSLQGNPAMSAAQ